MKKTFQDLEFRTRPDFGRQARLFFENGYGVSVVIGKQFYSNGVDTYELAVLREDGQLVYPKQICKNDDVLGYLTADQVTAAMEKIQNLPEYPYRKPLN